MHSIPARRIRLRSSGKMPTTSVRRPTSRLKRSNGLVERSLHQCAEQAVPVFAGVPEAVAEKSARCSADRGMRPLEIAAELGLSKATVSWHLRRLGADGPTTYIGRRAIVATLGSSGVRVRELCDIRIRGCRRRPARTSGARTPRARPASGRSRSAPTSTPSSRRTLISFAEPGGRRNPTPTPPAGGRDRRRGCRARL
jgi:DNA-binding transcriptional ArsR family regulator